MFEDVWDRIWEKCIEAFEFHKILNYKKGNFHSKFREIQVLRQILHICIVDKIWIVWFLNLDEIGKEVRIL